MTKNFKFGTVFFILLFVIFILNKAIIEYGTVEQIENVVITDRERIRHDGQDKYLIFTENEVFENTDTIWFLKFNSTDYYNQLSPGKTCDLTVNKFRIAFLSYYRNIIDYNC